MHAPKQPPLWDAYMADQVTPGSATFSYGAPGHTVAHYSTAEPGEDRDVFFTGSSYYAIRLEQAGNEPGYPTDLDDTTHHIVDGALEEDETVNLNHCYLPEDPRSPVESRLERLESELEILRRENRQLRMLSENSTVRQHCGDNEQGPDTDIEEMIEEELHTIERHRPRVQKHDINLQCGNRSTKDVGVGNWDVQRYHVIDLHSPTIDQTSFPAGYWSRLEQAFHSHAAFSRSSIKDVASQSPLATLRTAATMATPATSKERQCFGVTVRPSTVDVGISCAPSATREFGCTTFESDSVIRDWVDAKYPELNSSDRKLITHLIRSSTKNREEFVETIVRTLRKTTKAVGVETKPDYRSQFSSTVDEEISPIAPAETISSVPPICVGVRTESQMVEARPLLVNKSAMTKRLLGIDAGVTTEPVLQRSQGSQAVPDAPDVTGCGVQTEPIARTIERSVSPVELDSYRTKRTVETMACIPDPENLERVWLERKSKMQQSMISRGVGSRSGYGTPDLSSENTGVYQVTPARSRTVSTSTDPRLLFDFLEKLISTNSTSIHTAELTSSRPMSPAEVQQLFPYALASSPTLQSRPEDSTEHSISQSVSEDPQSQGFTVSTEKRVIDEQSQRHLLPEDVNLDELSRGGTTALESVLARSKPLSTTHVVREFQPTVEVIQHVDDQIPSPSLTSQLSSAVFTPSPQTPLQTSRKQFQRNKARVSPPFGQKIYEIPVVHTSTVNRFSSQSTSGARHSTGSSISGSDATEPIFIPVLLREGTFGLHKRSSSPESVFRSASSSTLRPSSIPSDVDAMSSPARTVPVVPTSVSQSDSSTSQSSHRLPLPRLPPRNNSFVLSVEAEQACKTLAAYYKSGKSLSDDAEMAKEMRKLRDIWFNLTSLSNVDLERLEDFLAILNEYHEQLVRDCVQSTNDQGTTCLHLAVGHGAWAVVNLIIDSGYAEPNRLNRSWLLTHHDRDCNRHGTFYLSIVSPPGPSAMTTLGRLFRLGDVNLRAGAASGKTPLMMAAQKSSVDVLELLLQHGACVNMQDNSGNTALMYAIQRGDRAVVSALLDRPDIDLSLRDNPPGPSAMTTLGRLFRLGDVNLRAGAASGKTPLMMAAQKSSVDVLELLLQHGACVNMQDNSGNTALMYAIQRGDRAVVSALLDRPDIDLSLRDNPPGPSAMTTLGRLFRLGDVNLRAGAASGKTPLMMAAQKSSVDVLELLLQHGACVNMQDNSGNTALMYAIQRGDRAVVSALLDRPDIDLSLRDNVSARTF
ncbi:hypothetical protein AHF37_02653 [Paragonimus kellicotti]|nr:hypothetical protein AHF37_02653 [Paragonimus kellicotti]